IRGAPSTRCRSRAARTLFRPEKLRRTEDHRIGLDPAARAEAEFQAVERSRACADSIARRPAGPRSLRSGQAALDRFAPAGFLRSARNAARRSRGGAAGGPLARTQPAPGTNHHGPRRFLAALVSAAPARAGPPLSETQMAGRSLLAGGGIA